MEQLSLPLPEAKPLSNVNRDVQEKEYSNHNLFKPPKMVPGYFYYTEIENDWIAMKK